MIDITDIQRRLGAFLPVWYFQQMFRRACMSALPKEWHCEKHGVATKLYTVARFFWRNGEVNRVIQHRCQHCDSLIKVTEQIKPKSWAVCALIACSMLLCGLAFPQLSGPQTNALVSVCTESPTLVCPWRHMHGTGFFVSPDTILTVRHVIEVPHRGITTVCILGKPYDCDILAIGEGEADDFALLRIHDYKSHVVLPLANRIESGKAWCYADFTNEECGTREFSAGTVTGFQWWGYRELKLRVRPGFSGGPCIGESGRVIGILSQGEGSRSGIVPIDRVERGLGW